MNNTTGTPGPWRWREVRSDEENPHRITAVLLETAHRPVPMNDPVIFALREDWLGLTGRRQADARAIVEVPPMIDMLRMILRAPHIGSDGPGSSTLVVQDFHLRTVRTILARIEGS